MRLFSLFIPLVKCSSPVDPCTELCNFDGSSICSGGSWTMQDDSCHGYVFRGDSSGGDYCYHTSATASVCPSSGEPVRPAAVSGLLHQARGVITLGHLLGSCRDVEEICGYVDELPELIAAVDGGSEFWIDQGGSRLLEAAANESSCRDRLVLNLVALVTRFSGMDAERFSARIGFTRFCRDNTELLRRLIRTQHGYWPDLPRFVPFVFNSVSLHQRAIVDLMFYHQVERSTWNVTRGPCESLGDVGFVRRSMTDYFELDLHFAFGPDTRHYYVAAGECIALSLMYNAPIDRALPRWFFNKLLNNRITMSDLELDDPGMYRDLRRYEREGRPLVRYALALGADDPVPDVADYVAARLASLAPPEVEARFEAIREGFNQVVPIDRLTAIASTDDIRTLVLGDPGISVDDLIEHTLVEDDLLNSSVIQWMRSWLRESPVETRRHFLNFVTGHWRLPLDGMAALPRRMNIAVSADLNVRADRALFLLEIPMYTNPIELASLLRHAV